MSARRGFGNTEYLKKKVPQNPKYQHVKTRLDTGNSLSKYMEKVEEIKKNYRYKKDELFKRLKVTTFAQLVIQVASVSDLNNGENNEELCRLDDNSSVLSGTDAELLSERTNGRGGPEGTLQTAPVQFIDNNSDSGETELSPRSTLQSVISGVGEMDLDKTSQKNVNSTPASSPRITNKPYTDCPYLLLDVRDKDEYEQCHIIGAYNYPIATLSRTMNPYTKEVLEYKNASGKIIILYDEDERVASQAATTMCERGFENLFMLSGGLKVIAQKFPEGLTTGSFPPLCQQSVPPTSGRKRSAPRPPSYPAENKWQFTPEDLNKIQFYLEDILIPTNTNSRLSRLSMGSAQSKVSSTRCSYTPSVSGSDSTRTQSSTRHWK
ncbi:centrosomal protein of 41 kDa-like [Acipenser ruthenus]|uniref:centrosomal protein of 41 kDa-like n=1 Tax=Acipenser ruthenus TaxID=7906 RepID=UPI00145C0F7C|nr:centrosomal protein of 41 kDa-like [Acipenser ruthenus]